MYSDHRLNIVQFTGHSTQSVLGEAVFPNYQPPSHFTFGVHHLYSQTGRSFTTTDGDQLDTQISEGFGDVESPLVLLLLWIRINTLPL